MAPATLLLLVVVPLLASLLAPPAEAKRVVIRNDAPRLDVDGNYLDAHDGCIVAHGGTYFLYGESYGNATGGTFPGDWGASPQLAVYTSPDLRRTPRNGSRTCCGSSRSSAS